MRQSVRHVQRGNNNNKKKKPQKKITKKKKKKKVDIAGRRATSFFPTVFFLNIKMFHSHSPGGR
jgi:hypothetical protein